MTTLNKMQQAFVAHKAAGCKNFDAAVAAGYAAKGAESQASRLLRKPAIRDAIKAATKPDAGRDDKPTLPKMPRDHYDDAMSFLLDMMNHDQLPIAMRADAAKSLLPYCHARMGEQGKKEKKKDNAQEIANGGSRFAKKSPPPLQLVRNTE